MLSFKVSFPMPVQAQFIPIPKKSGNEQKYMMVDACVPQTYPAILSFMEKNGIKAQDIDYFFLTHSHGDHIGNLADLRKKNPNMKIICHENAVQSLRAGNGSEARKELTIPTWSASIMFGLISFFGRGSEFPKVEIDEKIDIVLNAKNCKIDSTSGLQSFDLEQQTGLDAVALITPGHTKDSLSLLMKDGKNFIVGDIVGPKSNFMTAGKYYPMLLTSKEELFSSWKSIAKCKAETLVISHGDSIPMSEFRSHVEKL